MKIAGRGLFWATLAALVISCGGGGGASGFETPSGAMAMLQQAIEADDVEGYLACLPQDLRQAAEETRATMGDTNVLAIMNSLKGLVVGGEVLSEQIDGDNATVVLKAADGLEVTWNCVQEADGWKVVVGG